jgi:hypothetical protein
MAATTGLQELQALLEPFGLGTLSAAADKLIQADPTLKNNIPLLNVKLRDTKEYKDRFEPNGKGNAARRAAGLAEYDPATYLSTEAALRSTLRSNGMPAGFFDTDEEIADFIGKNIDPVELADRLNAGFRAALAAPQNVRDELTNLYGWNTADLAAYYLDPTKATDVLRTRTQAAQVAAQARQQAGMSLGAAEAEQLVQAGVGEERAREGFQRIAREQEIYTPTVGEAGAGEIGIGAMEQIGAEFATNAAAVQRVATRRRRRVAEFQAGGRAALSTAGE